MLTAETLHELVDLLMPFATGGNGILGLHTQVVLALGTRPDLLGRITMGGNAQEYITGLLKALDEYGETSPGTRALWQFMSHLKTQVGIDKQTRIDALKPILNAPPLPTIHTASSAPRVFLSYARSDGEGFAQGLRGSLERVGIPLWQDRVGMEGGRDWWLQITDAIEKVQFMVLVMTPNAMKSEVVRKEWRYARQHGVCVYPVKGAADLDFASLPKWMRDSHFYDLGFDLDHFEQGAEWGKFLVDLQGVCKTPRVPFMVEDMPSDFVPRPEEFEALKGKLLGRDGTEPVAITAALKGAGGYGKTTLAKALCHDGDIQTAFDDGILWVTLGEKVENLYEKVDGLIFALTGAKSNAPTLETATAKLVELFTDRDLLLVIDDVWDQVHLRPFLQGGKGCARLITTRNSDTLPSHVEEQTVDAMKPDEASQLLAAGIAVNDPTLHRAFLNLAGALGEWALLLKLANGVIRERIKRGETPAQALAYAQRTYEKRGVLGFDGRNPSERNQAAQLSLGISFDLLHEDEKQRFAELAIFPEDLNIPLVTLERLWAAAGLDDLDTERLCETLYRYSLLLNFDLKERTIRLHDVVRKYLRDTHQGEIAAWNSRFLDAYGVKARADLSQDEPYLWDQLAYHLIEAGRGEELRVALLDYRYLQAKLNATEIYGLIQDCDFLPKDSEIQLLKNAMVISASKVMENRNGLADQLVGRLTTHRRAQLGINHLIQETIRVGTGLFPLNLDAPYPILEQAGGIIRSILSGHKGNVLCVAWSPDGVHIVSAGKDKGLIIWNSETGAQARTISSGHEDSVKCLTWSPDARQIVSGSSDTTLKVWEAKSGAVVFTLCEHTDSVNSVRWSLDGRWIASASSDKTLIIWDANTGNMAKTFQGHSKLIKALAWSPDSKHIASASIDKHLIVWDVISGERVLEVQNEAGIGSVAWSPSANTHRVIVGRQDGSLALWDIQRKVILRQWQAHESAVTGVEWSSEGREVVSASEDYSLKVWDMESSAIEPHTVLRGHSKGVRSVSWSPDSQKIVSASGDRTLIIWNIQSNKVLHPHEHESFVRHISWSPDGNYVVSASDDKTLKIWNVKTGLVERILKGHIAEVNGATWSPDGQRICSASKDKTIKVWDAKKGQLLWSRKGHKDVVSSVAWSPDGNQIISASFDRILKIWDAKTGQELHHLKGHQDGITCVSWSPNGDWIVSVTTGKYMNLWDARSGRKSKGLDGGLTNMTSVAWANDSERIVVTSTDKTLMIIGRTGKEALLSLTGHQSGVRAASWSPNGRQIVSASTDKTLKIWETDTGSCLHTFYGDADFYCCAFSPDGTSIAAGDKVGRVIFLRWTGGEAQLTEAGIKTQQDR